MKYLEINTNHKNLIIEVAQLDSQFFPWPWDLNDWLKEVKKENCVLYAAVDNDTVIGYCLFSISELDNFAHLLKILIAPTHRGQKVAQQLHHVISSSSLFINIKTLYLEVSVKNEPAIKLYEDLGYEKLVLKKKFYSNGDDAFAMQKKIN